MPTIPVVLDLAYLAEPLTRFTSDILNLHNLRCKKGIWTNSCFAQLTRLPYELNLLSSLPRIASLWFKLCAMRMLALRPAQLKSSTANCDTPWTRSRSCPNNILATICSSLSVPTSSTNYRSGKVSKNLSIWYISWFSPEDHNSYPNLLYLQSV